MMVATNMARCRTDILLKSLGNEQWDESGGAQSGADPNEHASHVLLRQQQHSAEPWELPKSHWGMNKNYQQAEHTHTPLSDPWLDGQGLPVGRQQLSHASRVLHPANTQVLRCEQQTQGLHTVQAPPHTHAASANVEQYHIWKARHHMLKQRILLQGKQMPSA